MFAAFTDQASKAQWFQGPEEWGTPEWEMDFRVGGREFNRAGPEGGPVHAFDCHCYDIVTDERIVYAYEMYLDDDRISVSLATIEHWHHADEEFDDFASGQLNDTDVLLFGRVTYELMAGFWPTPAAQQEAAGWSNSRLVREQVAEEVSALKRQPDRSLGVLASPTLTAGLIRMGLLDELRMMVNPVALGAAGHCCAAWTGSWS